MIRILHPIMPFTERASGIPAGFEGIGNGPFIEIHPLPACRGTVHPAPHMIAPGQKLRPRRRTHRAHKETIEPRPIPCQRINMRRLQIRIAIEAEITPPLIIGQNDDHIRLLCLNPSMGKHQKRKTSRCTRQFPRSRMGPKRNFYSLSQSARACPASYWNPISPTGNVSTCPSAKTALPRPKWRFTMRNGLDFNSHWQALQTLRILECTNRLFFNPFIGVRLIGIRYRRHLQTPPSTSAV